MADDGKVFLDLGSSTGSGGGGGGFEFSIVEYLALLGFVGTVAFCTCQAFFWPRRTFCAQKMD